MKHRSVSTTVLAAAMAVSFIAGTLVFDHALAEDIVHDAEFYILTAQHGEKWAGQDRELDEKLASFRESNRSKPPNILFILIDGIGFGDLGSETLNVIRGYESTVLIPPV